VWIWGQLPFTLTAKDYEEVGAKLYVPGSPLSKIITQSLFAAYQGLYDTGTEDSFKYSGAQLPREYLDKLRGWISGWPRKEIRAGGIGNN